MRIQVDTCLLKEAKEEPHFPSTSRVKDSLLQDTIKTPNTTAHHCSHNDRVHVPERANGYKKIKLKYLDKANSYIFLTWLEMDITPNLK